MASVDASKLSQQELAQLACTYASLILYDDGQDITGDRIKKLISASGVKVQSYWAGIFAKAIEGQDLASFFNFGGSAGSSAPAPQAAKQTKKEAPKEASKEAPKDDKKGGKKPEPKKEQKPAEQEEDVGMGGLFD